MKLSDYKIIPGTVIDVADPKFIGRIKADAPGLFNSAVMNKEGMPWIYPLGMSGYQRFSKLNVGSKVWILTNNDFYEFWYWPMFELNQDTRDIISKDETDYTEGEVLLSRNMGDNSVYIYYTPSKGIMIQQGENTVINLTPDNKIYTRAGDGQVLIQNNNVYIGDTETDNMEKAVKGQMLIDYLNNFRVAFDALASAANVGYTASIAPALKACADMLKNPEKMLASKTYVD